MHFSISNEKLKHVNSVGKLMQQKAAELGWSDEKCEEMFVLGFLHDIGYQFVGAKGHSLAGGQILKRTGFKYFNEIINHGNPNSDYSSPELDLLNWADMQINVDGINIGFNERLNDIKARYGDSETYENCVEVCRKLFAKGLINKKPDVI